VPLSARFLPHLLIFHGELASALDDTVFSCASSTLGFHFISFHFLLIRFFVYNLLSKNEVVTQLFRSQLVRNGFVGLAASIVSDTVVNSLRVIKTTKQSLGSKHNLSYFDTIRMVLAADGWKGLFGRGLRTRILANALQSALFTIIWRGLADRWGNQSNAKTETEEQEVSDDSSSEDED
jgi:hypothetical protein